MLVFYCEHEFASGKQGDNTMTASELGTEFTLVQDSQEIAAVLEHLGVEDDDEFSSLFVEVIDGDYGRIYGAARIIVMDTDEVRDVRTWYSVA